MDSRRARGERWRFDKNVQVGHPKADLNFDQRSFALLMLVKLFWYHVFGCKNFVENWRSWSWRVWSWTCNRGTRSSLWMGSFGAVDPWTLATSWRKQVIQFVMIEWLSSLVLQMQGVSIPPTYASAFSSIAANGSDWWSLVLTFSIPCILASMLQGITLKPRMVSPPSVATDALKLLEFLVDRHPHQVAWVFL